MLRILLLDESRVQSFERCNRQYHLRYVERAPVRLVTPLPLHRLLDQSIDEYLRSRPESWSAIVRCVDASLTALHASPQDPLIKRLRTAALGHLGEFDTELRGEIPRDCERRVSLAAMRGRLLLQSRAAALWQDRGEWVVGIWRLWLPSREAVGLWLTMLEAGVQARREGDVRFLIVGFRPAIQTRTVRLDPTTRRSCLRALDRLARRIERERKWLPNAGHWCAGCHYRGICDAALLPTGSVGGKERFGSGHRSIAS